MGPGVLTDDAVTAFTLACSLGPELPFGFASVPSLSSVVLRSKGMVWLLTMFTFKK